jgi:methionyl-tRNA synthetase
MQYANARVELAGVPVAVARIDQLAVPEGARSFAVLGAGGRMVPGTTLPAPQPVFPRYVEPEAAS